VNKVPPIGGGGVALAISLLVTLSGPAFLPQVKPGDFITPQNASAGCPSCSSTGSLPRKFVTADIKIGADRTRGSPAPPPLPMHRKIPGQVRFPTKSPAAWSLRSRRAIPTYRPRPRMIRRPRTRFIGIVSSCLSTPGGGGGGNHQPGRLRIFATMNWRFELRAHGRQEKQVKDFSDRPLRARLQSRRSH